MNKNPRWFIRSHGHTLGPLTWGELESNLQSGDFGEEAKVSSDADQTWVNLFDKEELKPILLQRELNKVTLESPPPPSVYFSKKIKKPSKVKVKIEAEAPKITAISIPEIVEEKKPTLDLPTRPIINSFPEKLELSPAQDSIFDLFLDAKDLANTNIQKKDEVDRSQISFLTKKEEHNFSHRVDLMQESSEFKKVSPKKESSALEFKFTISKQILWIFFAFIIASAAYFAFSSLEKMRDPKDSHLSDPPSPTSQPSEESDPLPPLKAPTRPQRD